jgi:predicted ester cyclase
LSEENKALTRRFTEETLNQQNLAVADEIVTEYFVELDTLPGQEQGREGLKQVLAMSFAAFPDGQWTIAEQIAEGEKVVSRFALTGIHAGGFMGIPPTGRQVMVKGVVIDRIVNSKYVYSRILMDNLGMMQQLGVLPTP